MRTNISYTVNKTSKEDLDCFLENNRSQIPPPYTITNCRYGSYGEKLFERAHRFEAWGQSGCLLGLIAAYFNEQTGCVWIPYVCVSEKFHRQGIAFELFSNLLSQAKKYKTVSLEVRENNIRAIALYLKLGFISGESVNGKIRMNLINKT